MHLNRTTYHVRLVYQGGRTMRCLLLLPALIVFLLGGVAQACNNPNPNMSAPPFVDGCDIPAVALNRLGVPPMTYLETKTTAITAEGATLQTRTDSTYTAEQIANWVLCALCTAPTSYDALRGVAELPSGSTISLVNGVGAYVVVNTPISGSFPTGVGVFSADIAAVNNSSVWGFNSALTDNKGQVVSAGTGRSLNNEFDFNFTSPSSAGFGLVNQGASLSQPSFSVAFETGPLDLANFVAHNNVVAQWSQAFGSNDYSAVVGLSIGKAGLKSAASQSSQSIQLGYSNPANVAENVNFHAAPGPATGILGGGFILTNTEAKLAWFQIPGGFLIHQGTDEDLNIGGPINLGDGMSIFSFNDANNAQKSIEISGTTVRLDASVAFNIVGPFNLGSVTGAGAASKYVCVDSSNNVLVQTAAC